IPGENGDTVAENFVAGRTAAAEIVIVHAREIIVDEGIGVDAFHRAGERKRIFDLAAARLRRRQTKNRPQPFSTGEQTVANRLVNRGRPDVLFWKISIQRSIDRRLT